MQTLATSLIWGVNTLFLLDAGLSLTEASVANAAFTFVAWGSAPTRWQSR